MCSTSPRIYTAIQFPYTGFKIPNNIHLHGSGHTIPGMWWASRAGPRKVRKNSINPAYRRKSVLSHLATGEPLLDLAETMNSTSAITLALTRKEKPMRSSHILDKCLPCEESSAAPALKASFRISARIMHGAAKETGTGGLTTCRARRRIQTPTRELQEEGNERGRGRMECLPSSEA